MAQNDDLISRRKALRDLLGVKDVLLAQGDPFLAGVMNRAIGCIKNQPAVETENRTSDCDTCGKERFCQYAQGRHGIVRINCPLWRAKG